MKSQPDGPLPDPVRLERLFHAAANLPESEQADFLARECAPDGLEYQAVLGLLAAERSSHSVWNAGAFELEARQTAGHSGQAREGQFFGPYRILRHISTGGMGFVYEAVRADDQYQKKVAIKIAQRGVDENAAIIERFRAERQILARLEHPNIAPLLEGGTTSDGVPYLVMEYVDGVPLNQYAAQCVLTLRDKLKLFLSICDAVQYAHRSLVVHRDLKPSNILVTAGGVPKLLDFGIAKVLNAEGAALTATVGAMTLEYSSPEQVLGAPITASTDIYSLGVLLFELLSGRRPYRNVTSALELTQAICTTAPEPLGSRKAPGFDPDLEKIVQMALRKEPDRRYPSVGQFADDIRRYMAGYPISARTDTRGYRTSRFIARNKSIVTVGTLGVLALLAGIATTGWEARIADRRFNGLRKLANSYLFEFHDAIKDLPGSTPARQLVAKRALEYLDGLAKESGRDKTLELELATAYEKVGMVQGAPNYPSLGDRAGALSSYRKAQAIRERLSAGAPADSRAAIGLAQNYVFTALLIQHMGDLKGAADASRKAMRLMEQFSAAHPADSEVREMLAKAYDDLANVLGNVDSPNLGDSRGAVDLYRKALQIRTTLVTADPSSREKRYWLATSYGFVAAANQALKDDPGCAEAFRQGAAILEQLMREDPLNVMYRRGVAVYSRSLSLTSLRMLNLEEARKYGDRSAALFAELSKADPDNAEAQEASADSIWSQGYVLEKSKEPLHALAHYESAVAVYGLLTAKHPENLPAGLRTAHQLIAALATEMGDLGKGLKNAQNELDIDSRLLRVDTNNAGARRNQGVAYAQVGKVHELLAAREAAGPRAMAEYREARNWYQRSSDLWQDLKKNGTLIPSYAKKPDEAAAGLARCDRGLAGHL
ncbi:MAG TPA: protein kinase [Candidatus Sulfopaludibacter sp.]|nr:protein kinase [Candidatus Sulfopaludibacter sp.]